MARSRYELFVTLACEFSAFLAVSHAEDDVVNHGNVFQRIKEADAGGLTVGRHVEGRADPEVDILLDEQGVATGGRGNDSAPRPLFRELDESKLKSGTYAKFIQLLDNYVVRQQDSASYSSDEQQEIDQFVDEIVQTAPMAIALTYINGDLANDLSVSEFRNGVESIWFDLYTNHHGGATQFCSGFEHVFVGEGKFSTTGDAPRRGEIGGYHGWLQFYREEKADSVNYLGHKYDLPPARKPANPCVITLRMIWNHDPDGSGPEEPIELFKSPKGGFFVGLSPECEIAMGTVAFFEHKAGLLTSDNRRRTVIDGATYDLLTSARPSNFTNGESVWIVLAA